MSFWPLSVVNGYIRGNRITNDSSENSTMFYFGAKNPNKKKKKKRQSPSMSCSDNNNKSNPDPKSGHELLVVKRQERFEYYRVPLLRNESLHTVAMKYGCSVWELKRANRLWGLQDVHALTSLLVPAPRNSYRAELLASAGGRLVVPRRSSRQQLLDDAAAANADDHDDDGNFGELYFDDEDEPHDTAGDLAVPAPPAAEAAGASASSDSTPPRRPMSLRQAMSSSDSLLSPSGSSCDRFLRTLDADLEQIKQSTCFLKDSLPDVADYLNTPAVLPHGADGYRRWIGIGGPPSWLRRLKGTGVDCGLSWRGAVCLVGVLCLLLPALLYFAIVVHRRH